MVGAGAIQGEMALNGIEVDITMRGISDNVLEMSKHVGGRYNKLVHDFGLPENQDVELMMSLFEGYVDLNESDFYDIYNELRKLFRNYLVSNITSKKIVPRLLSTLLYINKNYANYIGKKGEKMIGLLTTNYDSLIEEAFLEVYGGLNCGYKFNSKNYRMILSIPPLLKLHGSFNWKIQDNKLEISKDLEAGKYEDDYSGWMPPSVYKKPSEKIFRSVWNMARELLIECDVLRVVGSSLRNEDWALISLLFTSQIKRSPPFNIELIVPDKSAWGEENFSGIMQRLPFLGNIRNLSSLPEFERNETVGDNVFHYWLLKKIKEAESKNNKISDDKFIDEMLYGGK